MVTFTDNIYTPLDRGMVLLQLSTLLVEVFTQRLYQKHMQSSKIFEEFEVRGQGRGQGLGNRGKGQGLAN